MLLYVITYKYCLTCVTQQQRQTHPVLGQNFSEFFKAGNTPPSEKFYQFVIAVTWLPNVEKVFTLTLRDTASTNKLTDKSMVKVDEIQQTSTIHSQSLKTIFI